MQYSFVSTACRHFRVTPEITTTPTQDLVVESVNVSKARRRHKRSAREIATELYHWTTCLFISALILAQLSGAVWNSTTSVQRLIYGQDPGLGPYQVVGTNDIPYTDRVVVCVRSGRYYEPRIVSSMLANEGVEAILEDSTGSATHGYRLVQRRKASTTDDLDSISYESYRTSCDLIAATIDSIFKACSALGYTNLTRDNLRVVDGATSNRVFRLPNSLPVLIMPFWDNAVFARHAIPTWDGDSCVFRLQDAYFGVASGGSSSASFRGVNQTIRHERTMQWLKLPGGVWRNGWYEDLEGERWFSDVTSSMKGAPYDMMYRMFDMRTGLEKNCSTQENCLSAPELAQWGSKFKTVDYPQNMNSITISNASFYGFFLYQADHVRTVYIAYDWETLVSNMAVGLVLIRWIMALVALHAGAVKGDVECFGGGIGLISCCKTFNLLLISMLPHLKMSLAAFWTVGCRFEGEQEGLSEAWFVIYPAIAQLIIMYFSLLNLLAKILRRRMSDTLFAPTVVSLCLLHYFRRYLAASGWLKGVDGRVPTIVFSDEVNKLQLIEFFTTDTAWRMNGRVKLLFAVKLAVLGVNLLPLLIARSFPVPVKPTKRNLRGIEKALAQKADAVGGLGISSVYLTTMTSFVPMIKANSSAGPIVKSYSSDAPINTLQTTNEISEPPRKYLRNYELIRLGYLVFGDRYVIAFDEWDLLTSMAPYRAFCHLWNHRIFIWELEDSSAELGDKRTASMRALVNTEPKMWRLDDQRLRNIPWWQVSSCAIQC